MIWHIFRKDLRLLWRLVLGVSALDLLCTMVQYKMDHGVRNLQGMWALLQMLRFMASGTLVAAAVHLDAIPGVRQDWLVRPIRRKDLLAAKILFVILLVQGPIFLAEFGGATATGFSFEQSLSASLSHSVYFLGACPRNPRG